MTVHAGTVTIKAGVDVLKREMASLVVHYSCLATVAATPELERDKDGQTGRGRMGKETEDHRLKWKDR